MSTPGDSFPIEEHEGAGQPVGQARGVEGEQGGIEPAAPELQVPVGEQGDAESVAEPLSAEEQLPPEARGEADGGPLGCCLGIMVGLLLSLSVTIASYAYAGPLKQLFQGSTTSVIRFLMVLAAIIGMIVCGYFGWKIGRAIYKEYEVKPLPQRSAKSRRKK